jgi:hypothetical protein
MAKLKNCINTFLSSPLCRGIDELCTTQHEMRALIMRALIILALEERGVTNSVFYWNVLMA